MTELRVMPGRIAAETRRRVEDLVAHEEEVLAAAFAEIAGGIERDAFAVAVGDAPTS